MAKRRKKSSRGPGLPSAACDYGPAERWQHGPRVVEVREATSAGVPLARGARNPEATPLDAYLRRGMLTVRQHAAGEVLGRYWRRAVSPSGLTARYDERVDGGRGPDLPFLVTGAAGLWRLLERSGLAKPAAQGPLQVQTQQGRAVEAVTAPLRLLPAGHVALAVCGMEEWAGGTRRLGKLRAGLDAVADALRMPREAP